MSTQLIKLNPNKLLLDSNFDGYKLSLEEIFCSKKDLQVPVARIAPDLNSYSYLHAKIYGLYNHLVGETLNGIDSVYFIDTNWCVCKTYVDPFSNMLIDPITVWQIPNHGCQKPNDTNVSFKMVNDGIAVLADGKGMLYLLDTGSRNDDDSFHVRFFYEVLDVDKNFIIVHARHNEESGEVQILLLSLSQENERFVTLLYLITLAKSDGDKWKQTVLRKMKTQGGVHYAYIASNCTAVYVVSENGCKFTLNFDCPVDSTAVGGSKTTQTYNWTQTLEEITLKFPLQCNSNKSLVKVEAEPKSIVIRYNEDILLAGKLYDMIDANLTTWSVENNVLEVVVYKTDAELMWPEFVEGDTMGLLIMSDDKVEEARQRLAHLTTDNEESPQPSCTFNSEQMEECDYESDTSMVFERLDRRTSKVTHNFNMDNSQILLTANLNNDLPPAIGIRHDVDLCLWQPQEIEDNFSIKHEGTLSAFSYVQASKQQRKFSVCAPDMSYSAVCETSRHLFVYRQSNPVVSGELRNRSTGRPIRNVAKQQVVNLPNQEIIGIYASNKYIYLLGKNFVMALQLQK